MPSTAPSRLGADLSSHNFRGSKTAATAVGKEGNRGTDEPAKRGTGRVPQCEEAGGARNDEGPVAELCCRALLLNKANPSGAYNETPLKRKSINRSPFPR